MLLKIISALLGILTTGCTLDSPFLHKNESPSNSGIKQESFVTTEDPYSIYTGKAKQTENNLVFVTLKGGQAKLAGSKYEEFKPVKVKVAKNDVVPVPLNKIDSEDISYDKPLLIGFKDNYLLVDINPQTGYAYQIWQDDSWQEGFTYEVTTYGPKGLKQVTLKVELSQNKLLLNNR